MKHFPNRFFSDKSVGTIIPGREGSLDDRVRRHRSRLSSVIRRKIVHSNVLLDNIDATRDRYLCNTIYRSFVGLATELFAHHRDVTSE